MFGVVGGFGRFGGFRVLIVGLIWVRLDKNDPKCNMVFDSDTFSEKMPKTAENDVWTKMRKKVRRVQGAILKRSGQKWGKMQHGVRAYN